MNGDPGTFPTDVRAPAPRRRSPLVRLLGVVVGLAVLGGLCFVGNKVNHYFVSKDKWAGKGSPVPGPATPIAENATTAFLPVRGVEGLRDALVKRVVKVAAVPKPATGECDAKQITASFTCTVTYEGQKVIFAVTTTSKGGGSYTWEAKPDKMVITRAGIHAELWDKYMKFGTDLRCEDGFPELGRAIVGEQLAPRCYFKPTKLGDHKKTSRITIKVGGEGLGLDHEFQD